MVYFVGAGPGDPDLLTIKGKKLLQQADTVIYAGSLVNPSLLGFCKEGARILDSSRMDLDGIIKAIEETEPGLTVRLQTGDTSLYSAISEQTQRLKELGIGYRTVPGVSSFCAAAAAMDTDYTVPGKSQSVIITRAAGRTPVPERESIGAMASHEASMVIFLSAGKTKEVSRALIEGGYDPDTPAMILYKASWPDEKKIPCTVGTLHQAAQENGIFKTALLIVGAFLAGSSQRSCLYDSHFTTGYRTGRNEDDAGRDKDMAESAGDMAKSTGGMAESAGGIHACAFTDRGYRLGQVLGFDSLTRISRSGNTVSLREWTAGHACAGGTLVFIGAAAIAVRAMDGLMKSKASDPAVIVIDEGGRFVIPLLSGHIGRANDKAMAISGRLKAAGYEGQPVITTASDSRGVFAVDSWATERNMTIQNPERIVDVTSKILSGESVTGGLHEEADMPDAIGQVIWQRGYRDDQDFQIRVRRQTCAERATASQKRGSSPKEGHGPLILIPRIVTLGIGCRRGTPAGEIVAAIEHFEDETKIAPEAIASLASIDLKKEEAGLLAAARQLRYAISFFTADRLNEEKGDFTSSDFVKKTTGTDNVCERAAVAASEGGVLIERKHIYGAVTLAAAMKREVAR